MSKSPKAEQDAPLGLLTIGWLVFSSAVIALDQYSKQLVVEHLAYREELAVTSFFSWVHWRNEGAAFSFLDQAGGWQRWAFVALAVVFSAFLIFELRRLRRSETVQALAFALILGGAMGNMIDRAALGYVVDFLRFTFGSWGFPAFNVADSAIFVGAVLWFTQIWRDGRQAVRNEGSVSGPPDTPANQ